MKKAFNILFPIKIQANILQLEGYNYSSLLKWIFKNYLKRNISFKKPLIFTRKVRILFALSFVLLFSIPLVVFLVSKQYIFALVIFAIVFTQPYILLGLSLIALKPYEVAYGKIVIRGVKNKILLLKNLKIIAITGSYGKSSTKEILYQLLKDKHAVLRTPDSFNTVLGISRVVKLELNNNYDYFICEMAAYKKGEISELCTMIPPHYGIITGISKQHLIRFGGINNIVKAKFELFDAIKNVKNVVFNLDDKYIKQELLKRKLEDLSGYGINNKTAQVKVHNVKFNNKGSSFTLVARNKRYKVKTILFGYSNIKNILAATSMALTLGIPPLYIVKKIKDLKQMPNRSLLSTFNGTVTVDNTYSSNPKGFRETIETAKKISGKKVLVTPGLVELGNEEKKMHFRLGQKSKGVFDKIILVGHTNRTRTFAKGFNIASRISYIKDTRKDYIETLKNLMGKYNWIFLENDITQNY